MTAVFKKMV